MKLTSILNYLPLIILPLSVAAQPNIMRWQTIGSPTSCTSGGFLDTIGFIGQPGVTCASLDATDPTLAFLDYFLNTCSINLYSAAGCANTTLELTLAKTSAPVSGCLSFSPGYRALSVTC